MWSSSLVVGGAPVRYVATAVRPRGGRRRSSFISVEATTIQMKMHAAGHPCSPVPSLSRSSSDARRTRQALGQPSRNRVDVTTSHRSSSSSSSSSFGVVRAASSGDSPEDIAGTAYDDFVSATDSSSLSSSRSTTTDDPTSDLDAEIEALAAARDKANAAAAAAQMAYVRAVADREAPPTASADEAEIRFNASPFVDVRCEYGYIQSNAGLYIDISKNRPPGVPKNILAISVENFQREFAALKAAWRGDDDAQGNGGGDILVAPDDDVPAAAGGAAAALPGAASNKGLTGEEVELMSELRDRLGELELSNDAIWERERARPDVIAPWIIKAPYYVLCYFLDAVFPENRPIQRFWFLETVARMPYFSYNTMLTLYELLGWWRRSSELRRVHFAEEWNEYHHLLIHESLGGDRLWRDRFLAQHSALVYYLVLIALWLLSPALAYNFSELIEAHAVDTYAQFADQNKDALRQLPAPRIAKAYYENSDLYLFDEFQTARPRSSRRPKMRTLYDTFCAIRDDEAEHVETMRECQMEDSMMAEVNKVNLGTAAFVAFIGVNIWLQRLAAGAGYDTLEIDGVDAGSILGEDGLLAAIARFISFLPFL